MRSARPDTAYFEDGVSNVGSLKSQKEQAQFLS